MKITRFEDIIAWQKAQDLAVQIYAVFAMQKDFGFREQIYRASVSISNNIAEGFGRESDKEFKRFLFISNASCNEVKSMLYLAERLNYIEATQRQDLQEKCDEISKLIFGFINYLKTD